MPESLAALLQNAVKAHRMGDTITAERLYTKVLRQAPGDINALNLLGLIRAQQRRFAEADRLMTAALKARANAETLNNHGSVLVELGRYAQAIDELSRAIMLKPDYAEAHFNLGNALRKSGRLEQATASFDTALRFKPAYVAALQNLSDALHELKRPVEAVSALDRAIALAPGNAQLHYNRGILQRQAEDYDEAVASFRRALQLKPNFAEAYRGLGGALLEQRDFEGAAASFHRTIELEPDASEAYFGLGNALLRCNRSHEAEMSYRRAIGLKSDFAEAHYGLGSALLRLDRAPEAIASICRAIELKSDFAEAHCALGEALSKLGRLESAAASFRHAWEIKPEAGQALAKSVLLQRRMCDWHESFPSERALIKAAGADESSAMAFVSLVVADDPAMQLAIARECNRALVHSNRSAIWQGHVYKHERIRLAYLSSDFKEHPVAQLMENLFENHDRTRFELYGISLERHSASATYRRLARVFDAFVDVSELSDFEAASRIRSAEIDIAIDLNGYTEDARPRILGHRAAPIQVNYLGYAGTTGADFMDYVIVDPFVVPPEQQSNFSERLVHLPDCYLVSNTRQEVAARTPSRGECGLPVNGFVFCCLSNDYKLTPEFFDIWMRLLKSVPESVLWLRAPAAAAIDNLRREATTRGVSAERLIFAPRVDLADYFARYRLADLFLDTLPYNAHSTAMDALWMGLPVLTCAGRSFAARVAGSLLHAVGLPELVTLNLADYESAALSLAQQPAALADIKEKLARNRLRMPLFNAGRYRHHIEAAYACMWSIWQQGEPPTGFAVEPLDRNPEIGP
jgi:protein O-GlcNAc transferase